MQGISVIIPTLNRTDFLITTLKDLVVQKCTFPFEIIIVDQSNEPDIDVINFVSDYLFVKYHHITFFKGLPQARNFGWQNAEYDFILYVDDDINCNNQLLQEHFSILKNKNTGVVAGGIIEKNNPNEGSRTGVFNKWTATPIPGFHLEGTFEVDHAKGCNFSTKKEVLLKVNGIDENLTKGAALYEETDFCLRVKNVGYEIMFHSKARLHHLAAETGGCRVLDIKKYIASLVRNRSLIIQRHLKFVNRISAHLYLLKLVVAYAVSYRKITIFSNYFKARLEGKKAGIASVKCTNYNE
ncbi:glycosyltransferase family 2 protein [Flavobacterium sp. N2270]|uniref:glycosyltransferase family 2 protein n=1 Tax=Flavobacterium sp. N2270 TaxID=2986831 RepID=UPI002225B1F4|nr:glycosyltransferase [Flavobacterium sp. N2270]